MALSPLVNCVARYTLGTDNRLHPCPTDGSPGSGSVSVVQDPLNEASPFGPVNLSPSVDQIMALLLTNVALPFGSPSCWVISIAQLNKPGAVLTFVS
jgi:hypothetical protein